MKNLLAQDETAAPHTKQHTVILNPRATEEPAAELFHSHMLESIGEHGVSHVHSHASGSSPHSHVNTTFWTNRTRPLTRVLSTSQMLLSEDGPKEPFAATDPDWESAHTRADHGE